MNSTKKGVNDSLMPFVRKCAGSSEGGKYSFRLLCTVPNCYREDSVSASRHTIASERHMGKACKAFAAQGWGIDGSPVCPDCRKKLDR